MSKQTLDTYIRLFNKALAEIPTIPKDNVKRFLVVKRKLAKYKEHIAMMSKK